MGSGGGGTSHWSVFDGVKVTPSTPETLMTEINKAIAISEYAHATALLHAASSSSASSRSTDKSWEACSPPNFDARLADEAYKVGCAALAAGKLDEAIHSLHISLSKCPPDKTSAIAKIQSLISFTSQQLHKPHP